MARKVKITRKQIKQDDKFLATMKDVTGKVVAAVSDRDFWGQYKKPLIVAGAVLLVVVIAAGTVFGLTIYQRHSAAKLMALADAMNRAPVITPEQYEQNAAMAQALGAYTDANAKWSAVAENYDAVATQYPDTEFGQLALFYAGNGYYELKEYQEAVTRYEKYLEKVGSDAPFAPLAQQSVGYAYEELGKLPEAEKAFLELVKRESTTTSLLAMFDLARIYEKQEKIDEAIATLKKVDNVQISLGPQVGKLKRQAENKIKWLEASRKKPS
ncbi:MAG: tetratricopeptide repeat protein [Candidatus Lernaella stagnicola]|nr:tetratricopeptide repeat protein [Candidatus Lernaella stagnicola]